MAAEALQWSHSGTAGGHPSLQAAALRQTVRAGVNAVSANAPVLALFGLPPAVAEPVVLLAEILGWRAVVRVCGGTTAARLCLAMLPAGPGELPPLLAWSPDNNLNERISAASLSIMEQPLCVSRLELLLQQLG